MGDSVPSSPHPILRLRQRLRTLAPLLKWVAAALLLLGFLTIGLSFLSGRKPAPTVPVGAVALTVKSTPTGATVQLNARPVGKTPVTLKVAPGTHKVTISRSGYAPVTRTVTVKPGKAASLQVALTAARPTSGKAPSASVPKPPQASTGGGKLLEVGARAPAIVLKDRSGAMHRLSDLHGQQAVLLFVWGIDAQAKGLIQELDARVRSAGSGRAAMVIVINGDRAALQKFATDARVSVPLLLGDEQIARTYGVPKATTVLYVVSEGGLIAQRQVKSIQLDSLFLQQQQHPREP